MVGGIFFQRLASDDPAPEVDWVDPKNDEEASAYLARALEKANGMGSYLTFRRGGGSCIGIVVDKLIHKMRMRELCGVALWNGPSSVDASGNSLEGQVRLPTGAGHGSSMVGPVVQSLRMSRIPMRSKMRRIRSNT